EPRPHGVNAGCERLTSSFAFPSFLKEGWREAPGWLAWFVGRFTTPPAVAGAPPHPRRGKKRQASFFPIPSFLKEGWREAPGWLAGRFTTPPAVAGAPPHPRRGKKLQTRGASA